MTNPNYTPLSREVRIHLGCKVAITTAIVIVLLAGAFWVLWLLTGYVHDLRLQIKEDIRQSRSQAEAHTTMIVHERQAFAAVLAQHEALLERMRR